MQCNLWFDVPGALRQLLTQGDNLMSTVAEIRESLTMVDAKLDGIATEIQALKDQIASGVPVSQEDLDNFMNQVTAIQAKEDVINPPAP